MPNTLSGDEARYRNLKLALDEHAIVAITDCQGIITSTGTARHPVGRIQRAGFYSL